MGLNTSRNINILSIISSLIERNLIWEDIVNLVVVLRCQLALNGYVNIAAIPVRELLRGRCVHLSADYWGMLINLESAYSGRGR